MQHYHEMMFSRNVRRVMLLAGVAVLVTAAPVYAYIGPGAGFAVLSSALVIVGAMASAVLMLFTWPIRWCIRAYKGRKAHARARVKRVVIIGLDGMEPTLVEQYMGEGRMPHLARLRERGCYRRLGTTLPALTPVAWASFLTGSNPGKHNVFDFLTRDKRTYLPALSSVHISGGKKPSMALMRKGKPFWNILGEHGIFSSIIRVPITFPPEKFRGVLLSGMCVPDLRGSQGTFSYYTSRPSEDVEHTGGEQIRVTREGNRIASHLVGPQIPKNGSKVTLKCPFTVQIDEQNGSITLSVGNTTTRLKRKEYSDWIVVTFDGGFRNKVYGICQFQLLSVKPHFDLYVTPIQINPENPAFPIAFPTVYSMYLAKRQGPFATLGFAEDTWALNEQILEDPGFLHQCLEADQEREAMLTDALDKVRRGLVVCVFDSTDRVNHMFWRYLDPAHPARAGFGDTKLVNAIPEHYARVDEMIGRSMAKCERPDTVLMVLSDHGAKSFRRGVDLNRWLIENGYMALKPDAQPGVKYLANVDWSKTRVYALGLAGMYLNIKGREAQGIVEPSAEADHLRDELCAKLEGLIDPQTGEVAIVKVYNSLKYYKGPYKGEAPDLMIGYNEGYRVSWEAAIGDITGAVFHDNAKAWSADHCLDPRLVPGVFFCNRDLDCPNPRIMDLGPTTLDLFGVDTPGFMDGRPLKVADHGVRFNGKTGKAAAVAATMTAGESSLGASDQRGPI
ncbi:MAG: alkaline phosphatase family protein [Planctomycetota bacterium]